MLDAETLLRLHAAFLECIQGARDSTVADRMGVDLESFLASLLDDLGEIRVLD